MNSRAEQRRLKLLEAEREQLAEEMEALKITEEQLNILKHPFRNVKFEFWDLDGLYWTKSSLYTRQYTTSVPVAWPTDTTIPPTGTTSTYPSSYASSLAPPPSPAPTATPLPSPTMTIIDLTTPEDSQDTIRLSSSKPRSRKPLTRVYSSNDIQLGAEHVVPVPTLGTVQAASARTGVPAKSRATSASKQGKETPASTKSPGLRHKPSLENLASHPSSPQSKSSSSRKSKLAASETSTSLGRSHQSSSPHTKREKEASSVKEPGSPMRDLDFNSNFNSSFAASDFSPSPSSWSLSELSSSLSSSHHSSLLAPTPLSSAHSTPCPTPSATKTTFGSFDSSSLPSAANTTADGESYFGYSAMEIFKAINGDGDLAYGQTPAGTPCATPFASKTSFASDSIGIPGRTEITMKKRALRFVISLRVCVDKASAAATPSAGKTTFNLSDDILGVTGGVGEYLRLSALDLYASLQVDAGARSGADPFGSAVGAAWSRSCLSISRARFKCSALSTPRLLSDLPTPFPPSSSPIAFVLLHITSLTRPSFPALICSPGITPHHSYNHDSVRIRVLPICSPSLLVLARYTEGPFIAMSAEELSHPLTITASSVRPDPDNFTRSQKDYSRISSPLVFFDLQLSMASVVTLLSLPHELLTLILAELALDDILSVRVTCHSLHKASQSLQLWHHVFHRSLGQTIAEPFFLPKPLPLCSPHDIERALRRWDAPWLPADDVQVVRRDVETASLKIPRFQPDTLAIAPGGRWALVGQSDGSIWYFDLSEDWTHDGLLEPHLLVPSPLPPGRTPPVFRGARNSVTLSVDWVSQEALGPSLGVHHLTQFRIAVLAPELKKRGHRCVGVWDVHVQDATGGPELCLGECLSSFEIPIPDKPRQPRGCLYGATLAYNIFDAAAFVLDWRDANGRGKTDEPVLGRWIPQDPSSDILFNFIISIHLLPGNRVLLGYESCSAEFSLHNWEQDYPLLSVYDLHTPVEFSPVWHFTSPSEAVHVAVQYPVIMRDNIQLVLPTRHYIYGLTVRMDDYSLEGVRLDPLLNATVDNIFPAGFQLNRGVGIRARNHTKDLYYATYSWTGKYDCSGNAPSVDRASPRSGVLAIDSPLRELGDKFGTSSPGKCLLDMFSNRVVVPNGDVTQFYTIFATKFSAEGERAMPNRIEIEREYPDDETYLAPDGTGGRRVFVYPGPCNYLDDDGSGFVSEVGEWDLDSESDLEDDEESIRGGSHYISDAETGTWEEDSSEGLDDASEVVELDRPVEEPLES
ncbi:hypothetical protein NMY22_g3765 [Coprinellus aureogranulatus]|nr:hypothetical protein NMY22_g3765 [Coprinellus aureogranulatus]